MGVKNWEEFLWKELHIIPVPDLKKGTIKLLDLYMQDGPSIRQRKMVRIGNMTDYGDEGVLGWLDEREKLVMGLRSLATGSNVDEPFVRDFEEGNDRTYSGSSTSDFLASLFELAKVNLANSQTLEIELKNPSFRKYEEDVLADLIRSSGWKPNVGKISDVERKGVSWLGKEKLLELWIVTELKFASSIGYNFTASSNKSVGVHVPGVELGSGVVLRAALEYPTTSADSRPATEPTEEDDDILYGFKAIRVKFDWKGNFISRRGQDSMGDKRLKVRAEDAEFNSEEDPEYHMGNFFAANSGDEEGTSIDDFKCVLQEFLKDEVKD